MRLLVCLSILFALLVAAALANTEKVIFIAPPTIELSDSGPALEALRLDIISPTKFTLKHNLEVAFPTKEHPRGLESWFLLQSLDEGQRYEVRICWAAIQPTEFWLNVYNVSHVFDTPELIQSLASFTERQFEEFQDDSGPTRIAPGSLLFLHIHAAADYFTTNETLMQYPPRVDVDIILDPYLANIFPASLAPTAIYILVLAVLAYYVSGTFWRFLRTNERRRSHQD